VPLPSGDVKIYDKDFLVGETHLQWVPLDENVELEVSNAPNVYVKKEYNTKTKKDPTYTKYTRNYRFTIRNRKEKDIDIFVYCDKPSDAEEIVSNKKYKVENNNFVWQLHLSPGQEEIITLKYSQYYYKWPVR
jgi:hypothetical protein